jgi:MFS transporter, UMF1 family
MLQRGDKKLYRSWAFYDWANSVYSLVISSAIFPIYYETLTVTETSDQVYFLGTSFNNTTLYTYALSVSFLIVAFMSPVLSGIADYTGRKKLFMQFFCYLGSFSVIGLYFFTGIENLWVGILFSILASIGFWGSLVFYNAYLPEVAFPEQQDKVSALGFSYGYIGSVILLIFNLTMLNNPEWYGITDPTLPARISFVSVGLWWMGFAQITFARLPSNVFHRKPERDFIYKGYRELRQVLRQLKDLPTLKKYLISFFMYSIGVQTIMLLAGIFGSKELGLATPKLIMTILLIQIVGIAGAIIFSNISKKYGNLKALKITIVIWILVTFSAFLLQKDDPYIDMKFYALGGLIGLVMGAVQSLSRSTYSKLLPEDTEDHATFFSFYDVTEKIAIVLGTWIYGAILAVTGTMRNSVLALGVFFILGLIVLSTMKKTKYVR